MEKYEQLKLNLKTLAEPYSGLTKGIMDAARLAISDLQEDNMRLRKTIELMTAEHEKE